MKDRIERIIPDPPKEGYDAYLYLITILKNTQKEKYYGGWHLGQYDLDPYQFSSTNKELLVDYATASKVEYRIMEYGTAHDMAYKERIMLDQANGGIGAAKSPNWYNGTNGGGTYSVSYTGEKQVNLIQNNLEKGKYKRGYSSKSQIADMINPELGGELKDWQVRLIVFDSKYVNIYMDDWDADPNPDNFPDMILLMPKKGSNDLPVIIGGNQTGRGCVISSKGLGMNHVEIPYLDWGKLSKSDLTRLGNRLNPRYEKPRKVTQEEDAARWIVAHCKEHTLTRVNSKMEIVWDFSHSSISKELLIQGWKKRQIQPIIRIAETIDIDNRDLNDNVIQWDEDSLKVDKDRYATWLSRKEKHLKKNDGDYDWVYKVSVDVGYHKIFEEIERSGFKTKGLVYFYFKNEIHSNEYQTNDNPENKHGVIKGEARWKKWQKEFLKGFDIEIEYLPTSKKKAIVDNWYSEKG